MAFDVHPGNYGHKSYTGLKTQEGAWGSRGVRGGALGAINKTLHTYFDRVLKAFDKCGSVLILCYGETKIQTEIFQKVSFPQEKIVIA